MGPFASFFMAQILVDGGWRIGNVILEVSGDWLKTTFKRSNSLYPGVQMTTAAPFLNGLHFSLLTVHVALSERLTRIQRIQQKKSNSHHVFLTLKARYQL